MHAHLKCSLVFCECKIKIEREEVGEREYENMNLLGSFFISHLAYKVLKSSGV